MLTKMQGAVLLGMLSAAITAQAQSGPLQVKTDRGIVAGALVGGQRVIAFRGIPYAAPPVGERRWKAPEISAAWKGIYDATAFGPHCVQQGGYPDMQFHDPGPSEDCLTLNVWTPVGTKPGSLPVMVWIYGGGFVTGGTSENRQDGEFLAQRNVVVVSMNYRLGIFGFFAHPELTSESPHHAAGNYGLLDQVAALQWVRRNIAAFGGDAKNVTIFGESAGSFAVSTLVASPLSKTLVNKAIGESGAAFASRSLGYPPRAEAEQTDAAYATTALGTAELAALRKVPTEDLVRAAMAKGAPRFGPDVDGYLLPESVATIYAKGEEAHVPLLAGWNTDEGRGQVIGSKEKTTPETLKSVAEKDFPGKAAEFLAVYPAGTDAEALDAASDYAGDRFIAFSTWRWLEAHTATGQAPVYRYLFGLGSPGDNNHSAAMGAFHSDDIEYVFGMLDSRPGAVWRPEDRRLSEQMGSYWTNFARTGDPNGPGLPTWPRYGAPGGWQVMRLDATSMASPDAKRPRYLFLDSVWGQPAK